MNNSFELVSLLFASITTSDGLYKLFQTLLKLVVSQPSNLLKSLKELFAPDKFNSKALNSQVCDKFNQGKISENNRHCE